MYIKKFILESIDALKCSLIIVIILYLILWPFKIDGVSMEPTLNSGDTIFMSRIMAGLGLFDRGDIVIVILDNLEKKQEIIKRIIAKPGDHLVIHNGNVYINNKILKENYTLQPITEGNMNIFLQKNQYFVMGDNRAISNDSRDLGLVYKNQISGRVMLRLFPLKQISLLTSI